MLIPVFIDTTRRNIQPIWRKSLVLITSSSNLLFLLDGEDVEDDQTAQSLELEDGDQIDVVLNQRGCYDIFQNIALANF